MVNTNAATSVGNSPTRRVAAAARPAGPSMPSHTNAATSATFAAPSRPNTSAAATGTTKSKMTNTARASHTTVTRAARVPVEETGRQNVPPARESRSRFSASPANSAATGAAMPVTRSPWGYSRDVAEPTSPTNEKAVSNRPRSSPAPASHHSVEPLARIHSARSRLIARPQRSSGRRIPPGSVPAPQVPRRSGRRRRQ